MTDFPVINFSEFSTLTQCERKWAYAYVLGQQEEGEKRGLHLGTLCHQWHASWLRGTGAVLSEAWQDDIEPGGKPGSAQDYSLSDFDPELVDRARWLAQRFTEAYGPVPPSSWTVIGAEEWMTRDFGDFTLVGRCDGLIEKDGSLFLLELKTYGSRPGPLAYASVSPQLGCYAMLVESTYGRKVDGIIMQGIYTYQWKRGVHAPEESFDHEVVVLGESHLATARRYLGYAVLRRASLADESMLFSASDEPAALVRALPNVGKDCSWCGFKPRCWNELAGWEPLELIVDTDATEPV